MESLNAACVVSDMGFLLYLTYCTKIMGQDGQFCHVNAEKSWFIWFDIAGEIFRLR